MFLISDATLKYTGQNCNKT